MREVADGKQIGGEPVTVAQIALAWLLHQEPVSSVIVGAQATRSAESQYPGRTDPIV